MPNWDTAETSSKSSPTYNLSSTSLELQCFNAFKADVPDVLKIVQPPFSFCQAEIFGPILASQVGVQLKR